MLNYLAYRISTVVIGQENFPLVNPALQATLPAVDAAHAASPPRRNPAARRHPDRPCGRGRRLVPALSHGLWLQDPHRRAEPRRGRVRGNPLGADDRAGHAPQRRAGRTGRHGRRAWPARSLLQRYPRYRFHLDRRWASRVATPRSASSWPVCSSERWLPGRRRCRTPLASRAISSTSCWALSSSPYRRWRWRNNSARQNG